MSASNQALIHQFYTAFQNKDGAAMAACYHENVVFEDPAFGVLKGQSASNMWKMLLERSKDLEVNFAVVTADESKGVAEWTAEYTFGKTGNKVYNVIHASFEFQDGKIIAHTDVFDLHQWARQAMGLKGYLLGGTSFFKKKLQKQTRGMLGKFEGR